MHEADGTLDMLVSRRVIFTQLPDGGATKSPMLDVNIATAPRASACFICFILSHAMWISDMESSDSRRCGGLTVSMFRLAMARHNQANVLTLSGISKTQVPCGVSLPHTQKVRQLWREIDFPWGEKP
jgi:hypothetical protein